MNNQSKPIYFVIIFLLLNLLSCTKEITLKKINILDIAELKNEYTIETNNSISGYFYDIDAVSDSTLFFTDIFSLGLFKVNIKNKSISLISKKGKGPGEQIKPYSISYHQDTLYVNDIGDNRIHKYSPDGIWLSQITPLKFVLGSTMTVYKNKKYFMMNLSEYYIESLCGENIDLAPICFQNLNVSNLPLEMYIKNDIIYYKNPYEHIIMHYNLKNKEKKEYKIDIKPNFNWKEYYNKIIPSHIQNKIFSEEFKVCTYRFDILNYSNNTYFLLNVVSRIKKGKDYGNKKYMINEYGKLLLDIDFPEGDSSYAIYNDTIYYCVYDRNNDTFHIREYKINKEKFTNMIN